MSDDAPFKALEAAYKSTVVGKLPPKMGITRGSVLNQILGTDEYLPDRMYVVTDNGVTLVRDEDDE